MIERALVHNNLHKSLHKKPLGYAYSQIDHRKHAQNEWQCVHSQVQRKSVKEVFRV